MTDLIVNFPRHRDNHPRRRAVQFADTDTAHLHIFKRYKDSEKNYIACHELWYTRSEHYSMRRAAVEDALQVRARISSGAPLTLNYSGNDEGGAPAPAAEEERSSVCCIGIEHLLTPAIVRQRRACIDRCIDTVLTEQERRGSSEMDIALASFVHSRGAALRARKLGRLHQDSI